MKDIGLFRILLAAAVSSTLAGSSIEAKAAGDGAEAATIAEQGSLSVSGRTVEASVSARGADNDNQIESRMLRTGIVQTEDGPIRGFVSDGVRKFLGIPYAAPPVDNLRWRPPQPHDGWQAPKDTLAFGNTCPQTNTLLTFAARSSTEDCLYLNVFAPKDMAPPTLPVMVWIHGGGLVDGESDDYNASALVKQGDVVVVTINYRLNVFGFFALPTLDAENHKLANYGLMDQQFALEWVRTNIAAFGGDPDNVTIFGESAGGLSVLANMASPTANGLFGRAIVESAARGQHLRLDQPDLATAEARGKRFAKAVGCSNLQVSCLRSLSVQELQAMAPSYTTSLIVDGTVLTQPLGAAFESGDFNHVPVINGINTDERRFAVAYKELTTKSALTKEQYTARLKAVYEENAQAVAGEYPLTQYTSPSLALAAATGDSLMICPVRMLDKWLSRFVTVFAYEFADRAAPMFFPPVSFPYGAAHTIEIQYLFPLYNGATGIIHPLNELQERLSDKMVRYWTTFAESGNPNSEATPHWPRYGKNEGKFQVLRLPKPLTISDAEYSASHKCDFWGELRNAGSG